ncbi:TPA: tyrosine-type recombinase/integrase [Pseudomonas aeruginosa]
MSKLTPKLVKETITPGSYQDGRGLIYRVSQTGRRYWVYRFMFETHRHDLELGTYPSTSLRDARLKADKHRLDISRGINPILVRLEKKQRQVAEQRALNDFETEAKRFIKTHAISWSEKHRQQWENSLATYVYPIIGEHRLADIDTDDVLEVLEPIWATVPVTANRVRNRIELVLDAAKARKLRSGENPARWRGHLDKLLPKQSQSVLPFPTCTSPEAKSILYRLDSLDSTSGRAAEMMILTALRNSEICGARWDELDVDARVWTIPPERMKNNRQHRVPLTPQMLEVIEQQRGRHAIWLFPNATKKGPLPGNAIGRALNELKMPTGVPHGFRSTFRTWCAEETSFPREVCELALAHRLAGKVEAAYNRSDLLEKRRSLMDAWNNYLRPDGIESDQASAA